MMCACMYIFFSHLTTALVCSSVCDILVVPSCCIPTRPTVYDSIGVSSHLTTTTQNDRSEGWCQTLGDWRSEKKNASYYYKYKNHDDDDHDDGGPRRLVE